MKSKFNLFIVLTSLTIMFIACDRPVCKNTNAMFDSYSPESREYKAELLKQLEIVDSSKLKYWFNDYVVSEGQELLWFNIQGDGLCAIIVLHVEQWGKLEELRQKKGGTTRGARFTGLKYDILRDTSNIRFIYRDHSHIID
ncbi:MAG: hypothetical protein AB9834_08660 [Lentimicrobium sp.]